MPRLVLPNFVGSRWQRNYLGNTMDCGPCCLPNQGWKTCDPWGIRCHHKSTGYLYCMVERGSFFWLNWLPDMASYFLNKYKKKKLSGMIDSLTMSIIIIIQASWFSSLKACRRFFISIVANFWYFVCVCVWSAAVIPRMTDTPSTPTQLCILS